MSRQKQVQVVKYNLEEPWEAVQVAEAPVPEPQRGEVVVHLQLRPVNPADIFSLQGVYPGFTPKDLPAVPGLEGVGVVYQLGPGATKWKEGQRVVGVPFPAKEGRGTWQQYVAVSEDNLLAVPEGMPDMTAAQFWVNPVTAKGFFDVTQVPKGEYLLNNAASSVLGRMVIQLGKHYGVKTINLVRSAKHVDDLKALGADEVIVSSEEDVVERVKQITGGKGAWAALEPVGGDITAKLAASLRENGEMYIYGAMAGFEFKCGIGDVLFRGVVIKGFWLNVWLTSKGDKRRAIMEEVMKLLNDGVMEPYTGQQFSLDEVKEAVKETQKPLRGGKCFLKG